MPTVPVLFQNSSIHLGAGLSSIRNWVAGNGHAYMLFDDGSHPDPPRDGHSPLGPDAIFLNPSAIPGFGLSAPISWFNPDASYDVSLNEWVENSEVEGGITYSGHPQELVVEQYPPGTTVVMTAMRDAADADPRWNDRFNGDFISGILTFNNLMDTGTISYDDGMPAPTGWNPVSDYWSLGYGAFGITPGMSSVPNVGYIVPALDQSTGLMTITVYWLCYHTWLQPPWTLISSPSFSSGSDEPFPSAPYQEGFNGMEARVSGASIPVAISAPPVVAPALPPLGGGGGGTGGWVAFEVDADGYFVIRAVAVTRDQVSATFTVPINQGPLEFRFTDPYGQKSSWCQLNWGPVSNFTGTLSEDGILSLDGSQSFVPCGRVALYHWRMLSDSPPITIDTTVPTLPYEIPDNALGGDSFCVRLSTVSDLGFNLSQYDLTKCFPLSVVVGARIGTVHMPDGTLITAVPVGNDVQVYAFPGGVSSREERALVPNATKPSLARAPDASEIRLMYQSRSDSKWYTLRSFDYGVSFEDWS